MRYSDLEHGSPKSEEAITIAGAGTHSSRYPSVYLCHLKFRVMIGVTTSVQECSAYFFQPLFYRTRKREVIS